jgi:putative CocE/NonD family hydrolase
MDNDRRSLTYTSEPLDEALEVTGHPMVSLQIDSTHRDGDFFVYLQDIDENGRGTYVSEGVLRASHRAVDTSAAAPLGLPVHPHTTASVQPLPEPAGQPSELLFDLHPTSVVFARGHRIRVSVACCDADNARTPVHDPPPTIRVHRGGAAASWISLPVVPAAPRQEHTA